MSTDCVLLTDAPAAWTPDGPPPRPPPPSWKSWPSIIDAHAAGEPVALALHGNRNVIATVKAVDRYEVELEIDGQAERLHKLQVKWGALASERKKVGRSLGWDKSLKGQPVFDRLTIDAPLEDAFERARANATPLFVNDVDVGTGERALDISRACVVAFDQVRVVAVHHADEVREFRRAVRVQPLSQLGRFPLDVDRKVRQFGGDVLLEETRFDSAGCFEHFLPILLW